MSRVNIIAALGKNRVLGKDNALLWDIPEDLKRFKQLTLGHPCIMGRKTFNSIIAKIGKPLPSRINIVVTRDPAWLYQGPSLLEVTITHSFEEALAKAQKLDKEEIFIIGGAQIYEQALPYADRLCLTLIDDKKDGDVFFPAYEKLFTKKISEETCEYGEPIYRFVVLER